MDEKQSGQPGRRRPNKRQLSRQQPIWPVVMMIIGGILILGASGWFILTTLNPGDSVQSNPVSVNDYPDIARVSLADAKAAYDTGSAVFLDVRDAESYRAGHIPSAVLMPEADLAARIGELDPADWIITY